MESQNYKTLAGKLSATFNIDGEHLDRYLARAPEIISTICSDLILHDQVLIPTSDYLTAAGLVLIIGESNLISLLEQDRLRIIRTKGLFAYFRGDDRSGRLVAFGDPDETRFQDCPIDESVAGGLDVIGDQLADRKKLAQLLIQQSHGLEMPVLVDDTFRDAQADLRSTSLWKTGYNYPHKDLIALPKIEKMSARMLGPGTDIKTNPIDLLLALELFNIEMYLASQNECVSCSTASPLGDTVDIKVDRLSRQKVADDNFWRILTVNRIPDFAGLDPKQGSEFDDLLKLIDSSNAAEFRNWFHGHKELSADEIFAAYLDLVNHVPWIQKLPSKALRFVITTLIGINPILGPLASFLDTFVVERVMKGKSPKYFIDDLKSFRGVIAK